MPDWVKHAIWWQVYPLGFASAETANEPGGDGARPVTHRLGQLNGWLDYAVNLGASGLALGPLTFVGHHDVTRLASRLDDDRHLAHALAALLTVGGRPAIYYGDEQAFRRIKEERSGGDNEIRPAFPGGPDGLAPSGWPVYRLHQDLIGLRRRHPWLHRAQTTMLDLASERMIYRVTAAAGEAGTAGGAAGGQRAGEQSLLVALSLAGQQIRAAVPGARQSLAGPGGLTGAGGPDAEVILPPHGWVVLA